jgi:hypothetical protein
MENYPETGGFPNGAMGIYITDIDIDPGGGCSESIEPDWWWNIFCDSFSHIITIQLETTNIEESINTQINIQSFAVNENQMSDVNWVNGDILIATFGCTDPVAANYDPDATMDDGSCEYEPHFIPETGGFPNGAMGIYITDIDIDPGGGCSESIEPDWWWNIFCDSLAVPWQTNDEIAVFDGDICVGSAKNTTGDNSPTIFVYEDNPSTPEQDGYTEGGELLFKYWHHSTQTELTNLHANYNPDSGIEPTSYYFEAFGALNAEFDVYFLNGCTGEEACNYDFATIDDGSCSTMEELGWCDCENADIDECGICGGSGIPLGECDCDGNELDCEGVCGGGAIIDECGICNGDGGDIECWNGSFACDEASCPTPFTGDMNTDGLLNILDVIILVKWILDDEPYILCV